MAVPFLLVPDPAGGFTQALFQSFPKPMPYKLPARLQRPPFITCAFPMAVGPSSWVPTFFYADGSSFTRPGLGGTEQVKYAMLAMMLQIYAYLNHSSTGIKDGDFMLFEGGGTWRIPHSR